MSTKVYVYGALAPTVGGDLLASQLRAADRYYNQWIEIERWRREQVAEVQGKHDHVAPFEAALRLAESAYEFADATLRASKSGGGAVTDAARAAKKSATVALKDARGAHKAAKAEARKDLALLAELAAITSAARQKQRDARAVCGVYWGTYLLVEESAEQAAKRALGAPPRFRRHDGSGALGAQIQGGMTVSEIFGSGTRAQISSPGDIWNLPRSERRRRSRTVARIRAGSNPDRSPVWIEVPIVMHRPLPSDAKIKRVKLLRKRVGLRFEHELHVVLESSQLDAKAPSGSGTVAINFGWRRGFENGEHVSTRVALWLDDQGQSGVIEVPEKVTIGMRKVNDLRSIRDKNFDSAKVALLAQRESIPEELRERAQYLAQWKAPGKLAGLASAWAKLASDPQPAPLVALMAWAKQDRHLLAWESHQRDRRINHRQEQYRIAAAGIARRYATIITGKFDMAKSGVRAVPAPEDGDPSNGSDQRSTAQIAAPGEARLALRHAAAKYGAMYVEAPSKDITQRCALCGCTDKWDAKPNVLHRCAGCGVEWDQDLNACRNLLAASGEVLREHAEALERKRSDEEKATSAAAIEDADTDAPGCSQ